MFCGKKKEPLSANGSSIFYRHKSAKVTSRPPAHAQSCASKRPPPCSTPSLCPGKGNGKGNARENNKNVGFPPNKNPEETTHALGWKNRTPAKKYFFCLVSGKQREPQKSQKAQRGAKSGWKCSGEANKKTETRLTKYGNAAEATCSRNREKKHGKRKAVSRPRNAGKESNIKRAAP